MYPGLYFVLITLNQLLGIEYPRRYFTKADRSKLTVQSFQYDFNGT